MITIIPRKSYNTLAIGAGESPGGKCEALGKALLLGHGAEDPADRLGTGARTGPALRRRDHLSKELVGIGDEVAEVAAARSEHDDKDTGQSPGRR